MFSSKSFIVVALTFRSSVHFELIFVYGVSYPYSSDFILLHMDIQLSKIHLLKRLFPKTCLGSLVKNQLTVNIWVYFWTLNFVPLISMSIFMPGSHILDYCSFGVSFEFGKSESSNFVLFFFQDCFGYYTSI